MTGSRIWDQFEATAARCGERDFLHVPLEACADYAASAITLSYAAARARALELADAIEAAGYGPGHRVALALDNRPEFFIHFLALNRLGLSIVPVNTAMSPQELSYVLAHAGVSLVVAHTQCAASLQSALPSGVPLQVSGAVPRAAREPTAERNEAALLYTSGTSGIPKACVLSDAYFLRIGRHYLGLGGYCRFDGREDRLATPLPVTHMNALAVSLMAMIGTGGCLVQLDRFHPSTWWQSLQSSRATAFHYLGVMPALLLRMPPGIGEELAGRLRFGFGAGVDPRHHAAFEARFGVQLVEAWAMTETGAGAWITANHEPRHVGERCVGRPPADLEVRLVDDDGHDVETGAVGELWVRQRGIDPRAGFFSGYYQDPLATEDVWRGGWFHTGDLLRAGADGSLFFVDRSKNIIRRSGENIAAVEVESALLTHPDVAAVAVSPVPDEIRGEEVFALVVLREGVEATQATAQRLQRHCLEQLAYHKAPGYVAFRAALPQTASQKLARGRIKTLCAQALREDTSFDVRPLKKRPAASLASAAGLTEESP